MTRRQTARMPPPYNVAARDRRREVLSTPTICRRGVDWIVLAAMIVNV